VGLWWTKRHWGRFSPSTPVSPANHHSTNFSIIITRGWHNTPIGGRSAEWTQMDPLPNYTTLKKIYSNFLFSEITGIVGFSECYCRGHDSPNATIPVGEGFMCIRISAVSLQTYLHLAVVLAVVKFQLLPCHKYAYSKYLKTECWLLNWGKKRHIHNQYIFGGGQLKAQIFLGGRQPEKLLTNLRFSNLKIVYLFA
jgi:hypothetical protein